MSSEIESPRNHTSSSFNTPEALKQTGLPSTAAEGQTTAGSLSILSNPINFNYLEVQDTNQQPLVTRIPLESLGAARLESPSRLKRTRRDQAADVKFIAAYNASHFDTSALTQNDRSAPHIFIPRLPELHTAEPTICIEPPLKRAQSQTNAFEHKSKSPQNKLDDESRSRLMLKIKKPTSIPFTAFEEDSQVYETCKTHFETSSAPLETCMTVRSFMKFTEDIIIEEESEIIFSERREVPKETTVSEKLINQKVESMLADPSTPRKLTECNLKLDDQFRQKVFEALRDNLKARRTAKIKAKKEKSKENLEKIKQVGRTIKNTIYRNVVETENLKDAVNATNEVIDNVAGAITFMNVGGATGFQAAAAQGAVNVGGGGMDRGLLPDNMQFLPELDAGAGLAKGIMGTLVDIATLHALRKKKQAGEELKENYSHMFQLLSGLEEKIAFLQTVEIDLIDNTVIESVVFEAAKILMHAKQPEYEQDPLFRVLQPTPRQVISNEEAIKEELRIALNDLVEMRRGLEAQKLLGEAMVEDYKKNCLLRGASLVRNFIMDAFFAMKQIPAEAVTTSISVGAGALGIAFGSVSTLIKTYELYTDYQALQACAEKYRTAESFLHILDKIDNIDLRAVSELVMRKNNIAHKYIAIFNDLLGIGGFACVTVFSILSVLAAVGAIGGGVVSVTNPIGWSIAGALAATTFGWIAYKAARKIYNHCKISKWENILLHEGKSYQDILNTLKASGTDEVECNKIIDNQAHAKLIKYNPKFALSFIYETLRCEKKCQVPSSIELFLRNFKLTAADINSIADTTDADVGTKLLSMKLNIQ
jgi:hypothetical protein